MHFATLIALVGAAISVSAAPRQRRAEPDNTVYINSVDSMCLIAPKNAHVDVGDSEYPGGMRSYCLDPVEGQGQLPRNFWRRATISRAPGASGRRQIQMTGCIRPETFDRINEKDAGGQYDSSGGEGGRGNPAGSECTGFAHYVELLEPAGNRACIRCCDDYDDCDLSKDTQGCPAVIPDELDYSDC